MLGTPDVSDFLDKIPTLQETSKKTLQSLLVDVEEEQVNKLIDIINDRIEESSSIGSRLAMIWLPDLANAVGISEECDGGEFTDDEIKKINTLCDIGAMMFSIQGFEISNKHKGIDEIMLEIRW